MKKSFLIFVTIIILLIGAGWWSKSLQQNDPNIISRNGIHWHPLLEVYVKGEKIEIPQNIGLVGVHSPIHTHDDLPIIHMEFSGKVTEEDTRLGNFFKVWGKEFLSFGERVTMTVNGQENAEFENYQMHDGDEIEIHYE